MAKKLLACALALALLFSACAERIFEPTDAVDGKKRALEVFLECGFSAEYGDSTGCLQRWEAPIVICVYGEPTDEDWEQLEGFLMELSFRVPTLPPIRLTDDENEANVEMFFLTDEELPSVMPEFIPGNRGFVYCYSEGSVFYTARIAIETGSTSQAERSHIIREELVNGLGLLNDHLLYSDSVIYQNYNNNMPTEMDWLMLNMVYSPLLWPGVERAQAGEILLAEILR